MRSLLIAVALLAGVTACNGGAGGDSREIVGVWAYDSYTVEGETSEVVVGVNAAGEPYVELGETMNGTAGCNGFEQLEDDRYQFENSFLRPGEVIFTASECVPESLMDSELIFQDVVWNTAALAVTIDGNDMTWQGEDVTLTFTRVDEAPVSTPAPQTTVGGLDCSPDPVQRNTVPAEGTNAEEVLDEADPQVSRIEVEDSRKLWAEGYDDEGNLILVVAFDDIPPETFSIYSCP